MNSTALQSLRRRGFYSPVGGEPEPEPVERQAIGLRVDTYTFAAGMDGIVVGDDFVGPSYYPYGGLGVWEIPAEGGEDVLRFEVPAAGGYFARVTLTNNEDYTVYSLTPSDAPNIGLKVNGAPVTAKLTRAQRASWSAPTLVTDTIAPFEEGGSVESHFFVWSPVPIESIELTLPPMPDYWNAETTIGAGLGVVTGIITIKSVTPRHPTAPSAPVVMAGRGLASAYMVRDGVVQGHASWNRADFMNAPVVVAGAGGADDTVTWQTAPWNSYQDVVGDDYYENIVARAKARFVIDDSWSRDQYAFMIYPH